MKVQYIPSQDKLILKIRRTKGRATRKSGPFEFWWDTEGISAVAIAKYTEELQQFRRALNVVPLGGIWLGLQVTDADIKKARKRLLKDIEESW